MTTPDAAPKPAPDSNLARRLIVVVVLGALVYGALIALRDTTKISERLHAYAWWTLAAACGLSLANYGLRFLKWEYYLSVLGIRGIPKAESLLVFLSGFVLTVTPGKVGEVFKSVMLERARGVEVARTAPIVVAERLTDLLGIVALITVGSTSFPGGAGWAVAGFLVVAAILVFVGSARARGGIVRVLPRLPGPLGRAGGRVAPRIETALENLRDLVAPRHLVVPTLLSIVGWSLEGCGIWLIVRGFGESATLPRCAFCYATSTLAGALVPIPGGLGITEKLFEQLMLSVAHVPEAVATAAVILDRLATLWFAVLVGFVALGVLSRMLRLRGGLALPAKDPTGKSLPDAV